MRTTQWARAAELFAELVELPAAERTDRLHALRGSDAEQHAAVLRLLALEAQPDAVDGLEAGIEQAVRSAAAGGDLHEGGALGPYRILRAIGEGGMGQVYLAERDIGGGVQRVALKIPQQRPGRRFIERFMRERGILAGLNHPAIARLVDSGTLDDGRPFFAMEYVDGLPITDYCDQHRLGIKDRLRLFLQVLPAVQHAHANLVLHRDIKAANVLVGVDGLPRLLDFGIAKSVDAPSAPTQTEDEARFFSLASAAPEQINGAPTSAATDIYALGALLYELVAGVPALMLEDLAPAQALAAITEQVPALPSAAVLALAERNPSGAQQIAARRGLGSPMALARQFRGDLGLVLARALRNQPRARYPSAESFARDLQAVLELRPIAQRHGDRWYLLERFLRRHRVAMISALLLIVSIAAYLMLAWRQADALALARDRAEMGREQAEQVTDFLVGLFRNADPAVARGDTLDAREMLERGTSALQSELAEQPALRARLLGTVADIYLALNDFASARRYAEQARTLRRGAEVHDDEAERDGLEQLARIALAGARYEDALAFIDEALQARPLGGSSDEAGLRLYGLRASALNGAARNDEALALFTALEPELERRFGSDDARTRALQRRFALALGAAGETARAHELFRKGAGSANFESFSNDPEAGRQALEQARLLRDAGDAEAALRLAREALRIAVVVYGDWHSKTEKAHVTLASIERMRGHHDVALAHLQRARDIVRRLQPDNLEILAMADFNIGQLQLLYRRDAAAALPYFRSAIAQGERAFVPGQVNLALIRLGYGQALRDTGDPVEARRQLDIALKRFREIAAPRGRNEAGAAGELACIDLAAGREVVAARATLARSIALLEREMPGHPNLRRLQACDAR